MNELSEATVVRYTGKKHTNLPVAHVELLNYVGRRNVYPKSMLSYWNSHHNNELTFAKVLLSLMEDGYLVASKVTVEPKPVTYRGTFTINPDGTASFVTDKLQYGPKLTLMLNGVDPNSTTIEAKVKRQAK